MEAFVQPVEIRWSDLDPNFHLRHSVYYDWAAKSRIDFLNEHGLTPTVMQRLKFGPIIFREECVFRKELQYGNKVTINIILKKARRDYSRWTIIHEVKKEDGTVCAVLTIDGAWLNVVERKLFIPPQEAITVFQQMPTGDGIEWTD
jgi:acyl-CoA thioester hydrolase